AGVEKAYGTGRRKTSVARVYLRPGSGQLRVNGRPLEEVFTSPAWREHARGPLVFTGVADQFDANITVKGGGGNGQAGAIRQGLARALALANPALRPKLRQNGFLTRDPRMKERKKYGQKGARKRFQWTKR
ncbi:MAG TPA: 30S ribosomal protein S9, partial [Candidatus Acidoferrales bacterium]|nr:30S ribosomal protein S9 [Candidatus Acidoferrales bacterium]